jgi:hypothetical protein
LRREACDDGETDHDQQERGGQDFPESDTLAPGHALCFEAFGRLGRFVRFMD